MKLKIHDFISDIIKLKEKQHKNLDTSHYISNLSYGTSYARFTVHYRGTVTDEKIKKIAISLEQKYDVIVEYFRDKITEVHSIIHFIIQKIA